MTDPRENQGQPRTGGSPYDDAGEATPPHGQGPGAYGPGDPTGHSGYRPQAPFGNAMTNRPGIGSRLIAFLTRDMAVAVAGIVTIVAGVLLLIAPRLAWMVDRSFDIVEGTMSVSATGAIDLSSSAQRALSDSDALELGMIETSFKLLLEPITGMLTLSGVLVIVGGLLILTTARQLGAVFAVIGVVPQLFVLAIGALVVAVYAEDTTPSPPAATSGPDVSPGAGPILTLATYVVVIACAIVAVFRQGERPRPASPIDVGPNGPSGGNGASEYYGDLNSAGTGAGASPPRTPGTDAWGTHHPGTGRPDSNGATPGEEYRPS
ncbi:hypothetical protein G6027_08455 [Dietzia sp. SLG310A2-38A2]|uniref:hypothetical protein n=1 Tax=Dietzia sp. SLG310A2-38A2 TaxID=1630643 RepID=UPI0015FE2B27|nr:hypothetical protein [Dietzia sp. SLG310A2-38A2]MBB1030920.1 hypothetical protein [Dietzia sp. SLG310A2-38A2]